MEADRCSPTQPQTDEPGRQGKKSGRLNSHSPEIANWLIRITRIHAHLRYIVRLFAEPEIAGGQSLEGETYSARAARGDRTLVYDAVGYAGEELAEIRREIESVMDAATPTTFPPGTAEKVAVMLDRANRGESLFVDGDVKHSLR
jgi:hypothetical protein